MNKIIPAAAAVLALAGGAYVLTRSPNTAQAQTPAMGAPLVEIVVPQTLSPEATMGQRGFDAVCAACHGQNATGRMGFGPPLVNRIYEPGHHGDMSFQLAVQNGVRAHHWRFGDMPPQPGMTPAEVKAIVAYVRALQRANGID
ncbi:c-type cytochrome [Chachezhania sediminis]|uniref:c-type cytochrome n=1 Tax=Chachezhania sediminis TaxID=2599291 RepID=UPI00131ECD26|nr:cytochrome c [Chachezhania sediminis]